MCKAVHYAVYPGGKLLLLLPASATAGEMALDGPMVLARFRFKDVLKQPFSRNVEHLLSLVKKKGGKFTPLLICTHDVSIFLQIRSIFLQPLVSLFFLLFNKILHGLNGSKQLCANSVFLSAQQPGDLLAG